MRLHDARYADFLDIVASLRETPAAQPRPEFVTGLRERLMTEAETVFVPAPTRTPDPAVPPARSRRPRATAGRDRGRRRRHGRRHHVDGHGRPVRAPGRRALPLKRVLEGAQTGSRSTTPTRAPRSWRTRPAGWPRSPPSAATGARGRRAIADTLNAFTRQADRGLRPAARRPTPTGDEKSIAELRDFTGESMQTLTELESVVPDQARDELAAGGAAPDPDRRPGPAGLPLLRRPASARSRRSSPRVELRLTGRATTPGTVLKVTPRKKTSRAPARRRCPGPRRRSSPGSVLAPAGQSDAAASTSSGGGRSRSRPTRSRT